MANSAPTPADGPDPANVGPNRDQWLVIGVSGVTCGGKTTLANRLCSALVPSYVLHQDRYFFPESSPRHERCPHLPHNNYDVLSALDMPRLLADARGTLAGEPRAHREHLPEPGQAPTIGKKVLIIEGFTVLNYKPLNDMCDLRYYFVLEYSQCLSRRCFRLYSPPDVAGYFDQCVWPEHLRHRAQIEKDKRVMLVDGTRTDTFDVVMAQIWELASE